MGELDRVKVRKLGQGVSELAVLEFQGRLREQMIESFRQNYLASGSYMPDARGLSSQSAQSIALAGTAAGATAVSAAVAPTLFMATANPATLMQLGAGVGSAVMGPAGIVAQAAFIPVAASLPVVAPILAMQAITAAVMLREFEKVDKKLDSIKDLLNTTLARAEATHAAELLTATRTVDEVYEQYMIEGAFSHDMLIRLSIAEHDIRRLAMRFRTLVESHSVEQAHDPEAVGRANYDAHSAMFGSFVELRIAYLRLCVDTQENPKSVARSVVRLREAIVDATEFWQRLRKRSEVLKAAVAEHERNLNDMNWAERFIGGRGAAAERKLDALRDAYISTMESELAIMEGFDSAIQSARQALTSLDEQDLDADASPTLVYWEDEAGQHSFSTSQLDMKPV